MINSRKIDDLATAAKIRALDFVHECKKAEIDLLVTCTYRDAEAQDEIYAHGRTAPGPRRTNARGGQSFHQYRVALDVVPLVHGKPVWNTADPIWARVGAIGEACGLEWAARWKRNREYAHFQFTGGLTLADFQAGRQIPKELSVPERKQALA